LQLSDLISADRDYCSHESIVSPSSSPRGCVNSSIRRSESSTG